MSKINGKAAAPDVLSITPAEDAVAAAACAGLRWVSDSVPGISRKRSGKGFRYLRPDGTRLDDDETLARVQSLAIPPAWTDVWISPLENGHLQATGRDAKGRKQYLYHPRWRAVRDQTKYKKCIAFGRALPAIRRRIEQDLSRRGLEREKVLAAVLRLLDATLIRVGNDEYARTNDSFGLTTIRDEHVEIDGTCILFEFRGKAGIEHRITFCDPRMARIVGKCQDLPGQELFAYLDDKGQPRDVASADVNGYLRETAGEEFTAKDFRTWAGTVLAAESLKQYPEFRSKAEARRNVNQAVDRVAEKLGNTRAISRKCYIHPDIIEAYLHQSLIADLDRHVKRQSGHKPPELSPMEAGVLSLLEERSASEKPIRGRKRKTKRQAVASG